MIPNPTWLARAAAGLNAADDTLDDARRSAGAQGNHDHYVESWLALELLEGRDPFTRWSTDGRYAFVPTGADETGGGDLWRVPERTTLNPGHVDDPYDMARCVPYFVGCVADPDNIDTAADNADEEMRYLLADAEREFG